MISSASSPRICLIALASRFVHRVTKDDFDGPEDDAWKHRRELWADEHPVAPVGFANGAEGGGGEPVGGRSLVARRPLGDNLPHDRGPSAQRRVR